MSEVANHGEMIVYQSGDGCPHINVRLENETVWLSIDQMAKLFSRNKSTISRHIKMQLLQILQQLPRTGKPIRSIIIIWI